MPSLKGLNCNAYSTRHSRAGLCVVPSLRDSGWFGLGLPGFHPGLLIVPSHAGLGVLVTGATTTDRDVKKDVRMIRLASDYSTRHSRAGLCDVPSLRDSGWFGLGFPGFHPGLLIAPSHAGLGVLGHRSNHDQPGRQ